MTAVVPLPDPATPTAAVAAGGCAVNDVNSTQALEAAVEAAARCMWEEIFIAAGDEIAWADVDEPMVRNGMLADAELLVEAIAPIIAAAERERIAQAIERSRIHITWPKGYGKTAVGELLTNAVKHLAAIARAGTSGGQA